MCHHCTNRGHWEVSFISILHLHVGFVLLDESLLSRNVKFWSSICKLFPGTCLFNQLVKFNISTTRFHWAVVLFAKETSWHFCDATKQHLRKECRNFILMTCHYPDLGSMSLCLRQISHTAQTIRNNLDRW